MDTIVFSILQVINWGNKVALEFNSLTIIFPSADFFATFILSCQLDSVFHEYFIRRNSILTILGKALKCN